MDEIVVRAIAKWPNVPSVYGWLSLDHRGNWAIKGERIRNPLIAEFIARNYARDERGRWFFQNGPQRVFVRLAYTPLVYRTRTGDALTFVSHTGQAAQQVQRAWLDEGGQLLVETELGIGVLHDQDLAQVLDHLTGPDSAPLPDAAVERLLDQAATTTAPAVVYLDTTGGRVPLSPIRAAMLPGLFQFDPDPRPAPGEPEC
jgi:Protein of unknown function (DUF2946)